MAKHKAVPAKAPAKAAAKPAKAKTTRKPAEAAAKSPEPKPVKKPKLVRDSFAIPKIEYEVLDKLKKRAASLQRTVKKSELLRAGIATLDRMGADELLAALNAVPAIKIGRPAK